MHRASLFFSGFSIWVRRDIKKYKIRKGKVNLWIKYSVKVTMKGWQWGSLCIKKSCYSMEQLVQDLLIFTFI